MHGTGVDTDWADLPLFRWNRQLQLSVSSGQTGTNAGIGPIGPRDPPVWPDVGRTDAGSELWLELRGKSPGAAVSIGLPEKNLGPAAWVFQPEIGTDISVVRCLNVAVAVAAPCGRRLQYEPPRHGQLASVLAQSTEGNESTSPRVITSLSPGSRQRSMLVGKTCAAPPRR